MKVLLVTSAGACGIAESSAYIKESVEAADPSIEITLHTDLHPASLNRLPAPAPDVVHLNYHAALHSQWTPRSIKDLQSIGIKVAVTWHDTGVPNSDHCKSIHAVADAFVVHEPCDDLPGAIYWRQGVPAKQPPLVNRWEDWPYLGSIGFAFNKNYDLLAEATAIAGWSLLLIAPGATLQQRLHWGSLNPNLQVFREFTPREEVVAHLSGCDATAFPYNNCSTGTSGAIRQGIAARKPVIASRFPFGRQFRDLHADPLASRVITWIEPTVADLVEALSQVRIAPIDAGMVALATQDSWKALGARYAALYKEIVTRA